MTTQKHEGLSMWLLGVLASGVGAALLLAMTAWLSNVDQAIAESRQEARSLDRRLTTVEANLDHLVEGQRRAIESLESQQEIILDLARGQRAIERAVVDPHRESRR